MSDADGSPTKLYASIERWTNTFAMKGSILPADIIDIYPSNASLMFLHLTKKYKSQCFIQDVTTHNVDDVRLDFDKVAADVACCISKGRSSVVVPVFFTIDKRLVITILIYRKAFNQLVYLDSHKIADKHMRTMHQEIIANLVHQINTHLPSSARKFVHAESSRYFTSNAESRVGCMARSLFFTEVCLMHAETPSAELLTTVNRVVVASLCKEHLNSAIKGYIHTICVNYALCLSAFFKSSLTVEDLSLYFRNEGSRLQLLKLVFQLLIELEIQLLDSLIDFEKEKEILSLKLKMNARSMREIANKRIAYRYKLIAYYDVYNGLFASAFSKQEDQEQQKQDQRKKRKASDVFATVAETVAETVIATTSKNVLIKWNNIIMRVENFYIKRFCKVFAEFKKNNSSVDKMDFLNAFNFSIVMSIPLTEDKGETSSDGACGYHRLFHMFNPSAAPTSITNVQDRARLLEFIELIVDKALHYRDDTDMIINESIWKKQDLMKVLKRWLSSHSSHSLLPIGFWLSNFDFQAAAHLLGKEALLFHVPARNARMETNPILLKSVVIPALQIEAEWTILSRTTSHFFCTPTLMTCAEFETHLLIPFQKYVFHTFES